MILNGKAEEDFENWFDESYPELSSDYNGDFNMPITSYNALIIEWLDTLRYKGRPMFEVCFEFFWNLKIPSQSFNDVCIQSIEQAIDIYNESKL